MSISIKKIKGYIVNNLLLKIKGFPFGLKVNFFLLKGMSTSGQLKLSFVIDLFFLKNPLC